MIQATRLTNLQLQLLKLFSREVSTYELLDIKRLLADYFSAKLTTEADKLWDEKGLNNDDMDRWLKELS
jgi:hypothetical protein